MPLLRPAFTTAVDLVLPLRCAGCAAPGGALCGRCRDSVVRAASWFAPVPVPPGLPPVAGAGVYGGTLRELVLAYKERGRIALARPLGGALAAAVELIAAAASGAPGGQVVLVPVPPTPASRRTRGDDHVLRLARVAAALLRLRRRPVRVVPVLRVARRLQDQTTLDAAGRAANLAGGFAARAGARRAIAAGSRAPGDPSRPPAVIVVDDILTTGATLAEATRALSTAGIPVVAGAVVAASALRETAVHLPKRGP